MATSVVVTYERCGIQEKVIWEKGTAEDICEGRRWIQRGQADETGSRWMNCRRKRKCMKTEWGTLGKDWPLLRREEKPFSDVTGGKEKASTGRDGFTDVCLFCFIDEVLVKVRWAGSWLNHKERAVWMQLSPYLKKQAAWKITAKTGAQG